MIQINSIIYGLRRDRLRTLSVDLKINICYNENYNKDIPMCKCVDVCLISKRTICILVLIDIHNN